MLAVYESIDMGLVTTLSATQPPALDLIAGNHPILYSDPVHDDTIYAYHAFGVHSLNLGPLLSSLGAAVRDDGSDLGNTLEQSQGAEVRPIVSTFSVERKSSNPVTAVAIPNDVYVTYSIFILTSAMRIVSFPLTVRSENPVAPSVNTPGELLDNGDSLHELDGPPAYVSLLGKDAFSSPSVLSKSVSGLPSNPRLALPKAQGAKSEFVLTPDTLRFLGSTVEQFRSQIREVQLAHQAAEARAALQQQELTRQQETCKKMAQLLDQLKGARQSTTTEKVERVRAAQQALLARLDRILQAMMQKASPELSEHETKWFRELSRMKEEVKGAGRYDQNSLTARTKLVSFSYIFQAIFTDTIH
jgi:nucleoporin NUP82